MRLYECLAKAALAVLLACLLMVVVGAAGSVLEAELHAQPPDAQSTSGPEPPALLRTAGLSAEPAVTVTIPGVPAYDWHHGCGPTAAGMVVGYWDGQGYDALVPGDASTQTAAVEKMMASEGPASNYTDYCEPVDYWTAPSSPTNPSCRWGTSTPMSVWPTT
jgi:hypothetical protein